MSLNFNYILGFSLLCSPQKSEAMLPDAASLQAPRCYLPDFFIFPRSPSAYLL